MARVLVVADDDPRAYVELWPDDDTGSWDGECNRSGCGWTVAGEYGRYASTADAVQLACVHMDSCTGA